MDDDGKDRLWDAGDVARYLGVDKDTVYRWAKQERLPRIKVGRLTRFDPDSVRQWAADREAA